MKIAVLVIVSNENLYLREFVEYYKNLKVDNIILGDNSPLENGEYPQMVIGDYIDSGFVKYLNYRGYSEDEWQNKFYNKVIKEYKDQYDWIAVFDVDEYIVFNDPSIHTFPEYLSSRSFKKFGQIKLNWKIYNDNDKLYYENKSLFERFPNPAPIEKCICTWCGGHPFNENMTTKNIINCKVDKIDFKSPHLVYTYLKDGQFAGACNNNGEPVNFMYPCQEINYKLAQLNHYKSLTISEYLYRKLTRNNKFFNIDTDKDLVIKVFWGCNEWTEEKQHIIDEFLKNL